MSLYWSATDAAIYYEISYSRVNGDNVTLSLTSTSINVTQLTPGYLYTFYLQSFAAGGASDKSNCTYSTGKKVKVKPSTCIAPCMVYKPL